MRKPSARANFSRAAFFVGLGAITLGALTADVPGVMAASAPEAVATEGKAIMRRLTPEQYRNIINEVFGESIELGGRFEPESRVDGLVEIGSGRVSMSSEGMAQFDTMARTIATQVVSEQHRDGLLPCKPKSASEFDEACAGETIKQTGRLLFRRPLTQVEERRFLDAAKVATDKSKDYYTGVSLSMAAMLASPQFLFRQVVLEPDPEKPGRYRLDAYSKATRLSFFLWNSMPDEILLKAAQTGELNTQKGLERQVARMAASPRLEGGVRAFFEDMFHFDQMDTLVKDSTLYPKFDSMVTADAKEQTLRTVADLLVRQRGDYRDIFTTHKTFLTQALASVYNVPLVNDVPNGSPDTWQAYEYGADDPRAGILTHLSFVALHSHPGRSSPTLRGKALREVMMCQKVPAPPGEVQFDIVQDTSNPIYKTSRDRLTAHQANPVCAGCHKLTDPMGFALENFDGGGNYRTQENGVALNTTGELEGKKFTNAAELGRVVHDSPATTSCVVDRLSAYALGRKTIKGESPWVANLKASFAKNGYNFSEMMKQVAASPELYLALPPANELTKTTLLTP